MYFDWTWTYLHFLQQRTTGDPLGDCHIASLCDAAELVAILKGYPAHRWSELYAYRYGGIPPVSGTCREELWPMTLIGDNNYDQQKWAKSLVPNSAATADAANFYIVSSKYIYGPNLVSLMQAEIMAGHACVVLLLPDHECVASGFDDDVHDFFCRDNRSGSPDPLPVDYATILGANQSRGVLVITDVHAPGPIGTPITVPMDQSASRAPPFPYIPPPVIYPGSAPPSPPPPTGNAVTVPALQSAVAALVVGQITQPQIDAIRALDAQLVADAVPVPIPAPTQPAPPPGVVAQATPPASSPADGPSFIDTRGNTWLIHRESTYYQVRCNGVQFRGMQSRLIVLTAAGAVKIQMGDGNWALVVFTGNAPTDIQWLSGAQP